MKLSIVLQPKQTNESEKHYLLRRIDAHIYLNWLLIKDGRHPAVSYEAVEAKIDELLDKRNAISQMPD